MRVRTSTGVRPTDFFGAFYMVRRRTLRFLASMSFFTGQHDRHGIGFIEQRHGAGLWDKARWQADRRRRSLHTGVIQSCRPLSQIFFLMTNLNQAALLYTSCSGQRRLRICNMSLNGEYFFLLKICSPAGSISRKTHICLSSVCDNMGELYRNCDLDTVVNFLAKQVLLISPKESRTHLELFRMCRS